MSSGEYSGSGYNGGQSWFVWGHILCALSTYLDTPLGWFGYHGYGQLAPMGKRGNKSLHAQGFTHFVSGRFFQYSNGKCMLGDSFLVAIHASRVARFSKLGLGYGKVKFDKDFYDNLLTHDGVRVVNLLMELPKNVVFGGCADRENDVDRHIVYNC
jgi:hypothetical protein